MLPTFREALENVSRDLTTEIMKDEVKRLEEITGDIARELRIEYDRFFEYFSEKVIGAFGKGTGALGDFANPPDLIAPYTSWTSLSENWMSKKEGFVYKQGKPFSTLEFYQGITAFVKQQGRYTVRKTATKGKGKLKKTRPGEEPFAKFVQRKSSEIGLSSKLFGPISFEYVIKRPDGGKVILKRMEDAIKITNTFRPKGKNGGQVFASFMEGTTLTITISAFGNVKPQWQETQLIDYLIKKEPSNKAQWGKINAVRKGYWKIRPVVMPLIEWYLKNNFRQTFKDNL